MAVDAHGTDDHGAPDASASVASQVAAWAAQLRHLPEPVGTLHDALLDAGGRQRGSRRTRSVDLTPSPSIDAAAVRMLLDGRTIRLSQLTPPDHLPALARRIRAVRATAIEVHDQHGLSTLTLTLGAATWTPPAEGRRPSAPVLLSSLRVDSRVGLADDVDLVVDGDWRLNEILVHHLADQFDVIIDPDDVLGAHRTRADALDRLAELAADVPGFRVAQRVEIANASAAVDVTADELLTSVGAVADHPVVAALVGKSPLGLADRVDGEAALTSAVLDADRSQQSVLDAVSAGGSVVVHAPPGTGATQTIANLVARLAADGRTALFVAAEPGSIRDVVERLDDVGLGDIVEHFSGDRDGDRAGSANAGARASGAELVATERDDESRDAVEAADAAEQLLDAHVDALHRVREPYGASVYQLRSRLLVTPGDTGSTVTLTRDTVEAIPIGDLETLEQQLAEWVRLGGASLGRLASPWGASVDRVTTAADAERAGDLAERLALHTVPTALDHITDLVAGPVHGPVAGVRPPDSVADWTAALARLAEVGATVDRFGPGIYDLGVDGLAQLQHRLAPAAGGRARRRISAVTDRRYRAAVRRISDLSTGDVDVATLPADVAAAHRQLVTWRELGGADGPPQHSPALAGAARAMDQLTAEVTALAAFTDDVGTHLDLRELGRRCRLLADDRETVLALPSIHQLDQALRGAGLHDVLVDVATRDLTPERAATLLRRLWLRSALDALAASDPSLDTVDGRQLDRAVTELRRGERVRMARDAATVRERAAEIGEAPCSAMSPFSVVEHVPLGERAFDVVIVERATRRSVAEVVPALLRARQVVAFGDAGDAGDAGETGEPRESVFEALCAVLPSAPTLLTHHYRSRDERLFAFAATLLGLDDRVTTWRGVGEDDVVRHVRVPRYPETGELVEVVQLVGRHVRERPDQSLGVVALDHDHARMVDDAIRLAGIDDRALGEFCTAGHPREPFFVKFVDHAGADVRDHIVVTAGGSPAIDGLGVRGLGSLVDDEHGVRRLAVATTRARRQMTVVTPFGADDLDDPRLAGVEGVAALQRFLRYAATIRADPSGEAPDPTAADPLELDIVAALRSAGVEVVAPLGVSPDPIAIAAMHPGRPARGVLAIETDGPAYAARSPARDRDRLRHEHLERLGWAVHQVWSADWLRDRDGELARIVAAWRATVDITPELSA